VGPSIDEFFPDPVLFIGTPFEMNRIMIIRVLVVIVLALVFVLGTRNLKIIPTRGQVALEFAYTFVRDSIVIGTLGEKDGKRFLPILMTIFFVTLGMDLTGTIPFLQIAGTSVIGVPLLLAGIAYFTWIIAGLRKHPGKFLRNALFPPGSPTCSSSTRGSSSTVSSTSRTR